MTRRKKLSSFVSSVPLKLPEFLLALFVLFGLGIWKIYISWHNSDYVGWAAGGAILTAGMIACLWLIWHRRKTDYNATMVILFVMQLANFVEGLLRWHAQEKGAAWPTAHGALAVSFFALIILSEKHRRKEAARDTTRELKFFDMEDNPVKIFHHTNKSFLVRIQKKGGR